MIRIGPAGIPLSCKGRTLKDGIIYTKSLELDALEVQFVRGIRISEEDAAEVGEVALEADVELHVHAPYYTNLAGDQRNLELTSEKVLKAAHMGHIMGAKTCVVHPGFYGDNTPEEALDKVVRVVGDLRDELRANQWTPRIAIETMGKRAVFGSLEEVIAVCQQVEDVLPMVDFAHVHARGNGSLNTNDDFQDVFDKLIPLGLDHLLIHFTGVMYDNGNERHHLPIKKGDLRFEPLAEVILENDYNVTVISNSPILEHDAMYMQILFDRVREKREQRLVKEAEKRVEDKQKEEEEARAQKEAEKKAKEEEKARKAAEKEAAKKAKEEEKVRKAAEKEAAKKAKAKESAKKAAPKKATKSTKAPAKAAAGKSTTTATKKKGTTKKATKKAADDGVPVIPADGLCMALTKSGTGCSNPPRAGSKYCSSHRGHRGPTKVE